MGHFAKFAAAVALIGLAAPAHAAPKASSGRQEQERGQAQIPVCTKRLGTLAIVDPDNNWWTQIGLGSPESIIKIFVQKSGCFGLVNRKSGLASRNVEKALAESGDLQRGSNIGGGQVKAADYFIVPDIVTSNSNSGGSALGGVLGGVGRAFGGAFLGGIAGGINIKKKEANVTLSLVNARTTEEERLTEGYSRKSDLSFGGGGGGLFGGGTFAGAGGGGYQNTDIGQVIVLAYLDAYTKMVTELGGLPANASAAAPKATN